MVDTNEMSINRLKNISNTNKKILLELRVLNEKPSKGIAYLLLITGGGLIGLHRFYLGKSGTAILMIILLILTLGIGTLVWMVVDLFLIPEMVQTRTDEIRQKIKLEFDELAADN
ncbi:MAG: TM2 domain-containing protein [Rhodospirillales bacterium]|nr:TM2 domain-containing protein [Rhodospirillales bacterium]